MNVPTCPDCGKLLPAGPPHALCPSCLMRQALASRTVADGDAAPLPPPAPEEIAAKFPQFEITECLGRGGMGVVYKARQKSLDRWVAIKILAPERVGEAAFAERFAREARTLARLNHPNIVTVYDHGETDGLFYIVMEFVDGVNLRDLLREGKLAPKQALGIVPPVCEALQFAHDKGIVHRDIKPENLLLDRDGRVKIADFGIATLMGATGGMAGTPPYMAPEQAAAREIDHRADIYALGVLLYEMLTGERPTGDFAPPSRKARVDGRIDEMVMRAMAKNPARRFATAGEFGAVAETLVDSRPPPMPAPKPKGMLRRWWWLFLVMFPVGFALGLAAAGGLRILIPEKYEVEAVVEIHPAPGDFERPMSPMFFGNVFEKLKSRRALDEVVRRLDLSGRWGVSANQATQILQGIISTQNIRGTDLISVRVRHTDFAVAADIVQAVIDVYRIGSGLNVIEHERPHATGEPAPVFRLNLLIGGLAGLLLSPVLALILVLVLHRFVRERTAGL